VRHVAAQIEIVALLGIQATSEPFVQKIPTKTRNIGPFLHQQRSKRLIVVLLALGCPREHSAGCDAGGVIMVQMQKKKITTYTGNYDSYVITRAQLEENQMKKYNWEQEQVLGPLFHMPCVPAVTAACLKGCTACSGSCEHGKLSGMTDAQYLQFQQCVPLPCKY
jgi:hypothetical protein